MDIVIFICLTVSFALMIFLKRKYELIVFLLPTLLFKRDDSVKDEVLSHKKLIFASVLIKISLVSVEIYAVHVEGMHGLIRCLLSIVISTILLEWILVLIVKGVLALTDKYFETNDGWFLIVSSFLVTVSTYRYSSKFTWLPMVIFLFVVINLAVSFKYMISLFIKREDYLKSEFGTVTAANQLYAIVMLVAAQIVNYAMLVYLFANSNYDYKLLYGGDVNKVVSGVWDIFYYVIITYTTVGYGDITPSGTLAQIVASMISFTSFFMSVAVIGIILSFALNKTVHNNGESSVNKKAS